MSKKTVYVATYSCGCSMTFNAYTLIPKRCPLCERGEFKSYVKTEQEDYNIGKYL